MKNGFFGFNPKAICLWAALYIIGYVFGGTKAGLLCLAAGLLLSVIL